MSYEPGFIITPRILSLVERTAELRERIHGSGIELSWIPALQKDTRTRNVHASTAIEGNPLTLAQVRALEEGREPAASTPRSRNEVLNYFAGLRYVEKRAGSVGGYRPPGPMAVPGLMSEFLDWWNNKSGGLSPVLSAAILHHRLESIHPFADGNGRIGRALALWELYRRGFDTHHIFSVDEYYWEDRPRYYAALDAVHYQGNDLTSWIEYCAEGLRQTLERVWLRVRSIQSKSPGKIFLRPRQERLLQILRDHRSMAPSEIWAALRISRQGAMDLLRPLMKSGMVKKVGGKKTGRYLLCR
ncbi:MAG: Fic family protein [Verrucomicrobia bacterium]|nr:Fic family protein [Verrucomicrobiota bacterium]